MSELSYNQKRDLVRQLQEAFSYNPEERYPSDTAHEIVDSWLPVYYNEIVDEWQQAGCPTPDDYMPEQLDGINEPIHYLMNLGLCEIANNFVSGAIWGNCPNGNGEPNDHAEALANLIENYPEHIREHA
jgi:hypothetical protein